MINIAKPLIGPEEKQAVLEVLESGIIAQGPRVKAFEEAFAAMCGVKHAIYHFRHHRLAHCPFGP